MSNSDDTLNLYCMDYWIPFPASEYGGLVIVAAENKQHVEEIAFNDTDWDFLRAFGESEIKSFISSVVVSHIGKALPNQKAGVVDSFIT